MVVACETIWGHYKRDDLRNLTQGNMSVEEYRLKFEELSIYVDTIASSDQEKKEMFY